MAALTVDPLSCFPGDYGSARRAFLSAAGPAFEIRSYPIAAPGPQGEPLHIDAAYAGADEPGTLLVLTSGTHGVEGPVGSALQLLFLAEHARQFESGPYGLLLVHALNPFGFAHGRRVNENNVDLNRNALESFPGPANIAYCALNPWLNPAHPSARTDGFWPGVLWHSLRLGPAGLRQAIAGGQYEFPRGLFFGGHERQESIGILETILSARRYRHTQRVVHLDLHSGLGRRGRLHLFPEHPFASGARQRWRQAFGDSWIGSDQTAPGGGYTTHGGISGLTQRVFRDREVLSAVLEAGTLPAARVLRALREENCRFIHASGNPPRTPGSLWEIFCPRDIRWRTRIVREARELFTRLPVLCREGQ